MGLFHNCSTSYKHNNTIKENYFEFKIYGDRKGKSIHYKDYLAILLKKYYNDSLLSSPHDSIIRIIRVDSVSVATKYVYAFLNSRIKDSIVTKMLVDSLPSIEEKPEYAKNGGYFKTSIKVLSIIEDSLLAYLYQNDSQVQIQKIDSTLKHVQQLLDDSILRKATSHKNIFKTAHGVYVEISKKGTGKIIRKGSKVTTDYNLYTLNNKSIEGSLDKSGKSILPLIFTIGGMEVIPALEEGITLFREGGIGRIYAPSNLAFGQSGLQNKILPGECVYFVVKILKVIN